MGPQYTELKSLVRTGGLHGVRGGRLPQHLRVLGGLGTFLIGGEQLHPPLRLLPDRHRQARRAGPGRTAPGGRVGAHHGPALLHGHRGGPDDLADGGAWLYAETVRQIHELNPGTGVELLIPDFNSDDEQLAEVFGSRPEVLAHNLETVPRIFKRIRPAFRYERSLEVLTKARAAGLVTKSNLILGMGETPDEVTAALGDLYQAGCEIITITQYLRPSARHHPSSAGSSRRSSSSTPRSRAHGLRRGDGRAAGALVLPGRAAPTRRPCWPAASSCRAGAPGRGRGATRGTLVAGPVATGWAGRDRSRPILYRWPQASPTRQRGSQTREARRVNSAGGDLGSLQDAAPQDKALIPLMVGAVVLAVALALASA